MRILSIQKIGHSFMVSIPKDIADDMELEKLTEVKATYNEETKEVTYSKKIKKVG
jgi:antitoxin component of MazEF toxin-antitoxin module